MAGLNSAYTSLYILIQTLAGLTLLGIGAYLIHDDGKSTFSRLFLLFAFVWLGIGVLGMLARWLKISLLGFIFFICVSLLALFQIGLFIAYTFFNHEVIESVNNTQGGKTDNVSAGICYLQDNKTSVSILLAAAAFFECVAVFILWRGSKTESSGLPN